MKGETERLKVSIEVRNFQGRIKDGVVVDLEEGDEISIWFKKVEAKKGESES